MSPLQPATTTCTDDQNKGTTSRGIDAGTLPILMSISDVEFKLIRELVYEKFGINLTEAKKSLVVGRLQKLIRSLSCDSFKQYYDYLIADKTGRALDQMVNKISTNHTFFYRESAHFEYFKNVALPEMTAALRLQNRCDLRVWCAGCSTGEEPYMLAMLLLDYFGSDYAQWNAGVLATDISGRALAKAVAGTYAGENVCNVPPWARTYFCKAGPDQWAVIETVKREVTFRRFNLMNEVFPFKKPFHVIFCRNVMIYFDQQTRTELLRKFYAALVPGGYFFVGHSESLGRSQALFEYVQPAIYRRRA